MHTVEPWYNETSATILRVSLFFFFLLSGDYSMSVGIVRRPTPTRVRIFWSKDPASMPKIAQFVRILATGSPPTFQGPSIYESDSLVVRVNQRFEFLHRYSVAPTTVSPPALGGEHDGDLSLLLATADQPDPWPFSCASIITLPRILGAGRYSPSKTDKAKGRSGPTASRKP